MGKIINMCEINTKICSMCGEEKPLTSQYFFKRKDSKDGFRNDCKVCRKQNRKKETDINWNKTRGPIAWKKYRQRHKEKMSMASKEYRMENKEQYLEWRRDYEKNKRLQDPFYTMRENVRTLIIGSFKKKGWSKNTKTYNILGCSFETFKKHIENQFQEGMTWENQGRYGWHYDHIIPISLAKTEEEVIKLNHYTNFQPLWAEDNIRKSNKISEEWGNIEN